MESVCVSIDDLINDMRVEIARQLDPISAFCYAWTSKSNYFLILGSNLFEAFDRGAGWDGKRVVSSSVLTLRERIPLAPVPLFLMILKYQFRCPTLFLLPTYITYLVLIYDSPTPEFETCLTTLINASKAFRKEAMEIPRDILYMAILWGNYTIAEYLATYPHLIKLRLSEQGTLDMWHRREYRVMASTLAYGRYYAQQCLLTNPYRLFINLRGSLAPLFRRFKVFVEAIGHPSLITFCTTLWQAVSWEKGAVECALEAEPIMSHTFTKNTLEGMSGCIYRNRDSYIDSTGEVIHEGCLFNQLFHQQLISRTEKTFTTRVIDLLHQSDV